MKLAEDPSYPLILRLQSLLEQIPIIEKVKIIGDGPSMDEVLTTLSRSDR